MTEIEALLSQARSDFQIYRLLAAMPRHEVPECHPLHYLQMAAEKLAKALLKRMNVSSSARLSHVAFSKIPQVLRRADIAVTLGWPNYKQYQNLLKLNAVVFREIEQLAPAVGNRENSGSSNAPNVEYPWTGRDAEGNLTWHVPAMHHFDLLCRLNQRSFLIRLLDRLFDRFENLPELP